MAEDMDINSIRRRFDERRDSLKSFQRDIDASLDYFSRVPESEEAEREQMAGMRRDINKLIDRLREFGDRLG